MEDSVQGGGRILSILTYVAAAVKGMVNPLVLPVVYLFQGLRCQMLQSIRGIFLKAERKG